MILTISDTLTRFTQSLFRYFSANNLTVCGFSFCLDKMCLEAVLSDVQCLFYFIPQGLFLRLWGSLDRNHLYADDTRPYNNVNGS